MTIVGASWGADVNRLEILCDRCGNRFWHRADRWDVRCWNCDGKEHLGTIRERYVLSQVRI